jgi:DNA gyrase subunit A
MQLRRLTGLEIEQLAGEYSKLTDEIADYELILSDERRVLDIIAEDMRELKEKYADERRTQITGAVGEHVSLSGARRQGHPQHRHQGRRFH